ncbi:MAG: Calx-beta domain-containing protein [Acidobacteriota bacterium]
MRRSVGLRSFCFRALGCLALFTTATFGQTIDRTFIDATGDATALTGRALDARELRMTLDASTISFEGSLASPNGAFDSEFLSGAGITPGSQRYLAALHLVLIDADDNPSTGLPGFGAEYILEVSATIFEDPVTAEVELDEPLVGFLKIYAANGAETVTRLSSSFSRSDSGFQVSAPRSSLTLGDFITVQYVTLAFGTDGATCFNFFDEPAFCGFESDFAPDSPARLDLTVPSAPATIEFTETRVTASESEGSVSVTVQLDPGSDSGDASVGVEVTGGTADASDFTGPTPRAVTFTEGETTAQVVVDIVDDGEAERVETIELSLVGPDGARLGEQSSTTLVIRDNDVPVTPETTVGSTTSRSPVVAYGLQGQRALVWTQLVGGRRQVFARVAGADGSVLRSDFAVAPDPSVDQLNPSATFARSGLAVVFETAVPGGAARSANGNLVGVFFSGALEEAVEELPLEDTGGATSPQVASDRNGNIVVSWNEGADLVGQEFGGNTQGSGRFPIGQADEDSVPETASSANGDYAVAWREGSPNGVSRIRVRRFRRGARSQGSVITVEEGPGLDAPSIAMAADGGFVVVYERPGSGGSDVVGARYGSDGEQEVPPTTLNADAAQNTNPSAAVNAKGDLVVVWEQNIGAALKGSQANGNLVGNFFLPDLSGATEEIVVAETDATTGTPSEAEVSIDDDDDTTVVYTRRRENQPDQIFETELTPSLSDGVCEPGDERLCLQGERFGITVQWQDFQGNSGSGRAVPLTTDSGYLWFFSESNVEMVIKVLNGCPLNDHFWVFAGGLTNVQVTVTVDDSLTGASRTYTNPPGVDFAPIQDTSALAACTENDRLVSEPQLLHREIVAQHVQLLAQRGAPRVGRLQAVPKQVAQALERFHRAGRVLFN